MKNNMEAILRIINSDPELKAKFETADQHPHWISVDDELPKENGRYLFYHTITGVQSAYYYNDLMLDKAVTHWMPLPAPPEHIADVSKKISSSEIPNNQKGGKEC